MRQGQNSTNCGSCAQIKRETNITRLQRTFIEHSLQPDRCVHCVQFKNTLPQITEMQFGLFLAQENVQKAELAKCISTALHHTHHNS